MNSPRCKATSWKHAREAGPDPPITREFIDVDFINQLFTHAAKRQLQEHEIKGQRRRSLSLLFCPPCAQLFLGEETVVISTTALVCDASTRSRLCLYHDFTMHTDTAQANTSSLTLQRSSHSRSLRQTLFGPLRWQKCISRIRLYAKLIAGRSGSGSRARNKICTLVVCRAR